MAKSLRSDTALSVAQLGDLPIDQLRLQVRREFELWLAVADQSNLLMAVAQYRKAVKRYAEEAALLGGQHA